MEKCEKCGTKNSLTHHHILPSCHFKGRGYMGVLCESCHKQIERIYLKAEGKAKGGKRNMLKEFEYSNLYYKFIFGEEADNGNDDIERN